MSGHPRPDRSAHLAHDIRAALSDVIGGLRLIDPEACDASTVEQLGRIQSAVELLGHLVDELLDDGEADPASPERPGNLNLRRFLGEEIRRWRGAARPLGATVQLVREPAVPEVVQLDGLRLRRVMSNLMGNALRHAPGCEITLRVALDARDALVLSVEDDGDGIPAHLLPNLFDASVRRDDSPGTGLGLQIAADHAEGIGARLSAENRAQGGACVTLAIPAAVWRRAERPAGAEMPDLSGSRILVADDSATNRLLVRAMLERLGAECETAGDGIEALNWLSRERFDLALVDVEMPLLDGIEVLRSERLRQARGVAPPMAMVAMTAHAIGPKADAIVEAGADGILGKPLGGVAEFGRAIANFLAEAPDPAAWQPECAPPLSAATLSELMLAAGPEYQETLVERLKSDLSQVESRLALALARGDLTEVHAQTHVLLSLTATIGGLPAQEAARHLNRAAAEGRADAVSEAGGTCLARLAELRAEVASIG